MTQDEYVTIMEAARRCGVSDKTIQRAIRRGVLPARYPQPNRCEIAVRVLETFKTGHLSGPVTQSLEPRVIELERRVQQLERQIHDLLPRQQAPSKRRIAKAQEHTSGPLPKQFVPLLAFARHHNVAEAKVQTHIEMGLLPVKRGEWTDTDGSVVKEALDAQGRHAFYQIYHDVPPFLDCQRCPHQER